MCEFCTEHGEGKKWYLQMKNYAKELLQEELSSAQRSKVRASTRLDWNLRFWKEFVMPAITGVPDEEEERKGSTQSAEDSKRKPSEEEILERRKAIHFGQVLPIEDVEEVIDRSDSITRFPCGCRFISTGKTDKRYCFGLGIDKWNILGEFPDAASSLEVLDKESAKRVFRQYDEEGLVHSIWTGVTPYVIGICNCDRDCMAYKLYIEQRGAPYFFRAEYVCKIDPELCTGCKSCISQCQFGAEFYSSALSKVYIDPTRCFGCGVCRTACPTGAITLVPRQSEEGARDIWLKYPLE